MDARTIKKLLVLNVLYCACAGFPRGQLLSARGDSYEDHPFYANSNLSKYHGNTAIVNRSATTREQILDNRVVQHKSTKNKFGDYEAYDQSPLSVMPEDDVIPGEPAVEHPAPYVPRGGSELAVGQIEQLLSANRNSRRKRDGDYSQHNINSNVTNHYEGKLSNTNEETVFQKRNGDYSQFNKNSNVTNHYKGKLSNTDNETFSQHNNMSNVTNYYGNTKSAPSTTMPSDNVERNNKVALNLPIPEYWWSKC